MRSIDGELTGSLTRADNGSQNKPEKIRQKFCREPEEQQPKDKERKKEQKKQVYMAHETKYTKETGAEGQIAVAITCRPCSQGSEG
jgi:hypothetical protein